MFDDSFSGIKWCKATEDEVHVFISHILKQQTLKTHQVSHVLSLCSRRTTPLIHTEVLHV